jgi:LPS-assembly protein
VVCRLALAAVLALPAAAQTFDLGAPGARLPPLDPALPWTIEADRIDYDQLRDEYVAQGHVVVSKQDRSITADRMRYNLQTMMAYAEGSVVITAGTDVLSGSYLEIDLDSEKGYLDDGAIFIKQNNYHIKGDTIQKTGTDTYHIDRGSITTCDGDPPDWRISGRDVKVTDDGGGSVWHALIYARDVPVGYFPYISYPARNKRQTGLLIPEGGYYQKKGFSYIQPFYWAINDSSDATFYLQYMSNRGWKPGLEYRYYLTREAKGALMFDYLYDDKVDDGTGNSSDDYGYEDSGGTFLRPNHERYWFRMSHENPLPAGVMAKLDLDIVSDQDYLQDFKTGLMGFDDTAEYFNKFFGRQLDDYNNPFRVNRLLLSKFWQRYALNAETRLYDDVRKGQNNKETIQKLPVVDFSAPKQPIEGSPLFYNLDTQYVNFWQLRGSRVQRMDMYPRMYYPLSLQPYLTLEPSVGVRETVWDQYETDDADPWSSDSYFHRELYDTNISLYTDFYRIYDIDWGSFTRLKHTVRPEIGHSYVPEVDQSSLPNIDSRDRVDNRNQINYALTNTLTTKRLKTDTVTEQHPRDEKRQGIIDTPGEYDYIEFLRLKFFQYYDFARDDKPFSPFAGKLEIFPGGRFSLDAEARYDVHDQDFVKYNTAVTLMARKSDRLHVEYRYDNGEENRDDQNTAELNELATTNVNKPINSLFTDLRFGLSDRLTLLTSVDYDFGQDRLDEYGLGFSYESQCWMLQVLYTNGSEDTGIGVRLRLNGIGGFGM